MAPSLVLEDGYTRFLKDFAQTLPRRPRGIVMFSAPWENPVQQVGLVETYDTIYDFYGFPEEMYQVT